VHNNPKDVLENLLSVWLLVHRILFIPSRFVITYTNFDIAVSARQRCAEKKFILVHIYILGLNYCSGIFLFKSLSYSYEVMRTIFSADFWTFRNF